MGLLDTKQPPNWYDPGKFWSGSRLKLNGATLGPEVAVCDIPPFVMKPERTINHALSLASLYSQWPDCHRSNLSEGKQT